MGFDRWIPGARDTHITRRHRADGSGRSHPPGAMFLCMACHDVVQSQALRLDHAQSQRSSTAPGQGTGITPTRFVEDALRARLADACTRKRGFRLRLETVAGTSPTNVDIAGRDALYEVIDRA